ncbi:hypothetical protein LTR05_004842 [Lithohypha guttulata]|uniref:Uncharacterized protein n=1 Tax=Lithohypha guttulata TaxID=1690604 RepID=A0AAN7Y6N3_9EURO|nr:hypothetical protein LTR05_004842 [Lithohypha guttulata]
MGFYTLINGMDALPDLDDDMLEVVLALYRSDIAEERAYITYGGESYGDTLTAIEFQLDEIEAQRRLVKDARLAQSITNAKLDDMSAIAKLVDEEKQALDDHKLAVELADPDDVPLQPTTNDHLPTYDEVIQTTTTPALSNLAGL